MVLFSTGERDNKQINWNSMPDENRFYGKNQGREGKWDVLGDG